MSNRNANAMRAGKKAVFLFDEGGPSCKMVLGGKGAGLVELVNLGVPVPPGFTVTTSVARAFAQHNRLPKRVGSQLRWQVKALEKKTGKRFGAVSNALLVSVRSGAAISMPGMMDTVLNLGMNVKNVKKLAKSEGARFAWDTYRRFLRMFGEVVLELPGKLFDDAVVFMPDGTISSNPSAAELEDLCHCYRRAMAEQSPDRRLFLAKLDRPWLQLEMAVEAVLRSWNSERACVYRRINKIANDLGTAVNVQTMVFGNRNEKSGTGVCFSHDVNTGEVGMTGEFLANAQGEDVVAGTHTPQPIQSLLDWNPALYSELEGYTEMLAQKRGVPVDIEFTIDSGKLYLLQVRAAKLSTEAKITAAVREVWSKQTSKDQALSRIGRKAVREWRAGSFSEESVRQANSYSPPYRGTAASPGAAVGVVVFDSYEAVRQKALGNNVVLVKEETKPEDMPGMEAAVAYVTMNGGMTSHAAVVARDLAKPAVVGLGLHGWNFKLREGMTISVDGTRGLVFPQPLLLSERSYKKETRLFVKWCEYRDNAPAGFGSEAWESFMARPMSEAKRAEHTTFGAIETNLSTLASEFYLSDSMARVAEGTDLESEAWSLRKRVHDKIARAFVAYFGAAIAGELRHTPVSLWDRAYSSGPLDTAFPELRKEFGVRLDGDETLGSRDRDIKRFRCAAGVMKVLNSATFDDQIRYFELAEKVFSASCWGGAMGGKGWKRIASPAVKYLTGEYSPTRFADHAFDLQHNTGSVFNKNAMFPHDISTVRRLLTQKAAIGDDVLEMFSLFSGHLEQAKGPVLDLYRKGLKEGVWKPNHTPPSGKAPWWSADNYPQDSKDGAALSEFPLHAMGFHGGNLEEKLKQSKEKAYDNAFFDGKKEMGFLASPHSGYYTYHEGITQHESSHEHGHGGIGFHGLHGGYGSHGGNVHHEKNFVVDDVADSFAISPWPPSKKIAVLPDVHVPSHSAWKEMVEEMGKLNLSLGHDTAEDQAPTPSATGKTLLELLDEVKKKKTGNGSGASKNEDVTINISKDPYALGAEAWKILDKGISKAKENLNKNSPSPLSALSDVQKKMLFVGAPGSGKSQVFKQLAEQLKNKKMPEVLFGVPKVWKTEPAKHSTEHASNEPVFEVKPGSGKAAPKKTVHGHFVEAKSPPGNGMTMLSKMSGGHFKGGEKKADWAISGGFIDPESKK